MPSTFGLRLFVSYLFLMFGGIFGIHRFALGYPISGIVYLCTAGVGGFGVLFDVFFTPYLVHRSLVLSE